MKAYCTLRWILERQFFFPRLAVVLQKHALKFCCFVSTEILHVDQLTCNLTILGTDSVNVLCNIFNQVPDTTWWSSRMLFVTCPRSPALFTCMFPMPLWRAALELSSLIFFPKKAPAGEHWSYAQKHSVRTDLFVRKTTGYKSHRVKWTTTIRLKKNERLGVRHTGTLELFHSSIQRKTATE